MGEYYYSLNEFLRERHGCKVMKLSLDAGFTCPNRDGKISNKGCLFCSDRGSGDFTYTKQTITTQMQNSIKLLEGKWGDCNKYIAYFQAFTDTYAPLEELKAKYEEALSFPNVVGLAIATRADCLSDEVIQYLSELSKQTHLWIEIGLQTKHDQTAALINRGYTLQAFEQTIDKLKAANIEVVLHLILGLPNETKEMMLETARYIATLGIQGVKIHMLHILKNSPLAKYYDLHPFTIMNEDEYIELVASILAVLPPHYVIHRLTGDGAKNELLAPTWTLNKRHVLNFITKYLRAHNVHQGDEYMYRV